MKNSFYLLSTFAGLLLLVSWTNFTGPVLEKASWLLGTWENKTPDGSMFETWTQFNEHEFRGISYMVKGSDTTIFENVRLVEERDSLFYIPVVNHQNNGQPVRFASMIISNDQLIFTNPAHDFPQRVIYTRQHENSMVAQISGRQGGTVRVEKFPMTRVNK